MAIVSKQLSAQLKEDTVYLATALKRDTLGSEAYTCDYQMVRKLNQMDFCLIWQRISYVQHYDFYYKLTDRQRIHDYNLKQ